ncbi:hypothetical protein TNCV_3093021, partial [Trichonephila clavipes]
TKGYLFANIIALTSSELQTTPSVGILVYDVSGSVVLMGWTKPRCSSFDRVRLTRYIGASKTVGDAKESWRKKREKRKRVDLSVSSRKKKTQLSTSAENSTADPENIFLPPKENESAF